MTGGAAALHRDDTECLFRAHFLRRPPLGQFIITDNFRRKRAARSDNSCVGGSAVNNARWVPCLLAQVERSFDSCDPLAA